MEDHTLIKNHPAGSHLPQALARPEYMKLDWFLRDRIRRGDVKFREQRLMDVLLDWSIRWGRHSVAFFDVDLCTLSGIQPNHLRIVTGALEGMGMISVKNGTPKIYRVLANVGTWIVNPRTDQGEVARAEVNTRSLNGLKQDEFPFPMLEDLDKALADVGVDAGLEMAERALPGVVQSNQGEDKMIPRGELAGLFSVWRSRNQVRADVGPGVSGMQVAPPSSGVTAGAEGSQSSEVTSQNGGTPTKLVGEPSQNGGAPTKKGMTFPNRWEALPKREVRNLENIGVLKEGSQKGKSFNVTNVSTEERYVKGTDDLKEPRTELECLLAGAIGTYEFRKFCRVWRKALVRNAQVVYEELERLERTAKQEKIKNPAAFLWTHVRDRIPGLRREG